MMRKQSSVPELKGVGSSSLANRRASAGGVGLIANSEEREDMRDKRKSLLKGWRDDMPDVRTLMKVDGRTNAADLANKIYKTQDDSQPDDSPKGDLRHAKSYRFSKQKRRTVDSNADEALS
jgi:hypothetical protein